MGVAERAAERSVRGVRARAEAEVRALVEAGLVVLRRAGASGLTVADVLAEAGLSTRAFYRHFASRDELVLAVFEHENRRSVEHVRAAIAATPDARAALETWIDHTLALAFDARRARRTQALWAEGTRLRGEHPAEFEAIVDGLLTPVVELLARGRDDGSFPNAAPNADARTLHDIVWGLAQRRLDGDTSLTRAEARAHALRFCLPALGARR